MKYRLVLKDEELNLNEMSSFDRENLARRTNDVNILRKLSEHKDKWTRRYVAQNNNTPIDILKELADDESIDVREGVATNTNTPVDILEKLSKDEYWVRKEIIGNPSTPIDILIKLFNDEDRWLSNRVKSNPTFKKYVKSLNLNKLDKIDYIDEDDKKALAKTSKDPEVLEKLSEDYEGESYENMWVRILVANNKNTPVDILENLAKDDDNEVRKEARKNLKERGVLTKTNKTPLSEFELSLGEPDGYAPSGWGATFTSEVNINISNSDCEGKVTVYGNCEDYQQWDDEIEVYCSETGKDEGELLENKCNSETEWDLSEEAILESLDEFLEDNDIDVSESTKNSLIQKIITLAKKGIKKYWSWNQKLVDDFNNWEG